MDVSLSKLRETARDRGAGHAASTGSQGSKHGLVSEQRSRYVSPRGRWAPWTTGGEGCGVGWGAQEGGDTSVMCSRLSHSHAWQSPTQVSCNLKQLVTQSCHLTLCDPMDYSLPDSSVHGILQARGEWVATAFSRGSPQPREQTWVSCTAGRCFTI